MLSPRESTTRERVAFDGLSRFALDREGRGRSERWWARTLPGATDLRVDGNKKGVFTRDRRPKVSAHALRPRWRGEP